MDLIRQIAGYLLAHKRWVLVPVILAIVLVGLIVAVSAASPLSPFVYPMF
jgi:uncharacterized membrane protein YqhA